MSRFKVGSKDAAVELLKKWLTDSEYQPPHEGLTSELQFRIHVQGDVDDIGNEVMTLIAESKTVEEL